jgi:hypothetical protein
MTVFFQTGKGCPPFQFKKLLKEPNGHAEQCEASLISMKINTPIVRRCHDDNRNIRFSATF